MSFWVSFGMLILGFIIGFFIGVQPEISRPAEAKADVMICKFKDKWRR